MRLIARWNARLRHKPGQILILFALYLLVLVVMVGLAIDVGFAYVTKGQLSKAVDAAALAGLNNINLGTVTATSVASATFAANYAPNGKPGRDVAVIAPSIVFSNDANGNTTVNVSAQTQINTYFTRVVPAGTTFTVGSFAQATRAKLIVELVLDKSGSMVNDGGAGEMPGAVSDFLGAFDDNNDKAGLVTFSSAATNDVAITQPFQSTINTKVSAIFPSQCVGGTFGQGGLTNALVQIQAATLTVPAGQRVVKAVVFFTDGLANIVQDPLPCNGPSNPSVLWNFGGYDPDPYSCPSPCTIVGFFLTNTGSEQCDTSTFGASTTPPPCCTGTNMFRSAIDGNMKLFVRSSVTADAEYRSLQVANQMRASSNIVYSIGMGSAVNQEFLREIANDPTATNYVATSYDGEFIFANDSGELRQVFQRVAEKILLRLTQ